MSSIATVDYEVRNDVAWIHLNRPERLNAVVPELIEDFCLALRRAMSDDVAAAVLAGRGRAFCAGVDLKRQEEPAGEFEERRRLERIQDVTRLIHQAPFPIIAAVHGYALGAGCEFALSADLIIASSDANFGFPEVSVGLSVTGGISHLLPLSIGMARAKELVLLGELMSAERAHALGLVNLVVALDRLEKEAAALANRLRERPRLALALAKRALDQGAQGSLEQALELEIEHAQQVKKAPDAARAKERFRARSGS